MAANKLNTSTVAKILADLDGNERYGRLSAVARKHDVSVAMVWMIDRRKFWAHVPRPSDREPSEAELDAMIEERYATMPVR